MAAEMDKVAVEVRAASGKPYIIPGGGSNVTGALGYVNCALELVSQANDLELKIDWVVHATGSSGHPGRAGGGPAGHALRHPCARHRRARAPRRPRKAMSSSWPLEGR